MPHFYENYVKEKNRYVDLIKIKFNAHVNDYLILIIEKAKLEIGAERGIEMLIKANTTTILDYFYN